MNGYSMNGRVASITKMFPFLYGGWKNGQTINFNEKKERHSWFNIEHPLFEKMYNLFE